MDYSEIKKEKKEMKKQMKLMLAMLMIVPMMFVLAACGGRPPADPPTGDLTRAQISQAIDATLNAMASQTASTMSTDGEDDSDLVHLHLMLLSALVELPSFLLDTNNKFDFYDFDGMFGNVSAPNEATLVYRLSAKEGIISVYIHQTSIWSANYQNHGNPIWHKELVTIDFDFANERLNSFSIVGHDMEVAAELPEGTVRGVIAEADGQGGFLISDISADELNQARAELKALSEIPATNASQALINGFIAIMLSLA